MLIDDSSNSTAEIAQEVSAVKHLNRLRRALADILHRMWADGTEFR